MLVDIKLKQYWTRICIHLVWSGTLAGLLNWTLQSRKKNCSDFRVQTCSTGLYHTNFTVFLLPQDQPYRVLKNEITRDLSPMETLQDLEKIFSTVSLQTMQQFYILFPVGNLNVDCWTHDRNVRHIREGDRVGSDFFSAIAGRVGSTFCLVGSKKSDLWTNLSYLVS